MQEIEELKRQGLSIQAISKLTGYDRKTVRKYLIKPVTTPVYGPRESGPSKLDSFKTYIRERLKAGVWNARVIMRVPEAYASPAACAMQGQAYLAETAIGRSLSSNDRVKVVCMLPSQAEEAMANLGSR